MDKDFKVIYDDVMRAVKKNRSIESRISKLMNLGYQVATNDHYRNVCYKYGDKATKFRAMDRNYSGQLGRAFLKKSLGRNSGYARYIQISKKIGVDPSFRYTQLTYFVIIPVLKIRGYLRKLKLRKIERNNA